MIKAGKGETIMHTIDKKQFGAFVAGLRKEKGFTQKELAARLFVSDKAVSKWETGASLPDTSLLMPLAECLGVTVTELLLCRKDNGESLTRSETEKAVQTAIGYSEPAGRIWQSDKRAVAWYGAALLCAVIDSAVVQQLHLLNVLYLNYMGIFAFFGAYFCLFAQRKLPGIYDQASLSFMSDGPVRMNLPGVHFNNRNWPHMLRVAQIWAVIALVTFPWLYLAFQLFAVPVLSASSVNLILLFAVLGSLFVPLIVAGRKYE